MGRLKYPEISTPKTMPAKKLSARQPGSGSKFRGSNRYVPNIIQLSLGKYRRAKAPRNFRRGEGPVGFCLCRRDRISPREWLPALGLPAEIGCHIALLMGVSPVQQVAEPDQAMADYLHRGGDQHARIDAVIEKVQQQ
jgi:hypothetical protein